MENVFKIIAFIVMNGLFFLLWKRKGDRKVQTFITLNVLYILLCHPIVHLYGLKFFQSIPYTKLLHVEFVECAHTIESLANKLNTALQLDYWFSLKLPIKGVMWGLIGFITAIYIFILGAEDNVNRNILTLVTGYGTMFQLGISLCLGMLVGVPPMFLLGGVFSLILMLLNSVKWMTIINQPLTFYNKDKFEKMLKKFCQNENEMMDLLCHSKYQLMIAINNEDIIKLQNTYKVFEWEYLYFSSIFKKSKFTSNEALEFNGYGLYRFIVNLYDLAQSKDSEQLYLEIQELHFLVAEHFYSLGNYSLFSDYLSLFYRNYEHYNDKSKKYFIRHPFSRVERFIDQIYKNENESQKINVAQVAVYKSLHETIKLTVDNKDYKFIRELLKLSENRVVYGYKDSEFKKHKSFYMAEYCFLWGLLVYTETLQCSEQKETIFKLASDKIKSKMNSQLYDDNFLIKVYNFIRDNDIPEIFNWRQFFMPEIPISGGIGWSRKDDEVEIVLLKLLGKLRIPHNYEPTDAVLSRFHQNLYVFKCLLNDESKSFDNKEKLDAFIAQQSQVEAEQRDCLINKELLCEKKIKRTKSIIQQTLEENRLLKYLDKLEKYKSLDEESPETVNALGFKSLMPKDMFVKSIGGQSIGFENVIVNFADELNNVVSKVFIEPIDQKSSTNCKTLSDAVGQLKSYKGQTVIFFSKMGLYSSLLKEGEYITSKGNLDCVISTKYSGLIEGTYNNGKNVVPIFYIRGSFKGAYIFKIDSIDKFVHYNNKNHTGSERISFSSFRLCDVSTRELAKKSFGTDLDMKDIERFRGKVSFELFQKGRLLLSDNESEIYKIEYNDLIR